MSDIFVPQAFLDGIDNVSLLFNFKSQRSGRLFPFVLALCRIWCTFSALILKIFAILPVLMLVRDWPRQIQTENHLWRCMIREQIIRDCAAGRVRSDEREVTATIIVFPVDVCCQLSNKSVSLSCAF